MSELQWALCLLALLLPTAAFFHIKLVQSMLRVEGNATRYFAQRTEAREAARWLYESSAADDKKTARERWPWIDREDD